MARPHDRFLLYVYWILYQQRDRLSGKSSGFRSSLRREATTAPRCGARTRQQAICRGDGGDAGVSRGDRGRLHPQRAAGIASAADGIRPVSRVAGQRELPRHREKLACASRRGTVKLSGARDSDRSSAAESVESRGCRLDTAYRASGSSRAATGDRRGRRRSNGRRGKGNRRPGHPCAHVSAVSCTPSWSRYMSPRRPLA
jgi:hypothetical protein